MTFPPYKKYKHSGVDWLGLVPEHWQVKRLKFLCDIQTGDKDTENAIEDGVYPFFVRSQIVERINTWTFNCEAILTAGDGAGVGKVFHYYNGNFDFHQRVYMMNNFRGILGQFLFQFIRENFYKVALEGGAKSTVDSLRRPMFTNFPVVVPPTNEQNFIVKFVEHETAKIDALVSEQQRLIELLKEKRQAVISHAVTKGLNPHAKMKPSGVEWLGDVPEHWEVRLLRRFSCIVQTGPFGSQLHADEYVTGGIPVINPTNMINGRIVPTENITVTNDVLERLPHQKLCVGDVIFSRRGELGRCALVTETEEGWLCGTGSMILRLHHNDFHSEYLSHYLSLGLLRQYFESFSVGAVMDSLNSETLLSMPLIVPSLDQQSKIVEFIKIETAKIDALLSEQQRAIELLQERRTALISAAVTGQIDVRGVVRPGGG